MLFFLVPTLLIGFNGYINVLKLFLQFHLYFAQNGFLQISFFPLAFTLAGK